MASLAERIAGRARRFGPLPWSVFMEAALYDEDGGFYQSGGAAGRGGDFVTSPELGPLFAEMVARALDRWWDELGRPDPFFVVEAGAGVGTLARDVLAAAPACSPALRYVLVERSAALREAHVDRLALELPAFVLGASAPAGADSDDEGVRYVPAQGPMATSLAELPALTMTGVILANELLDNLPFDLVELRNGSWQEVRAGAAGDGDELVEVLVPASPDLAAEAGRLAGGGAGLAGAGPGGTGPAGGGVGPAGGGGGLPDGTRVPVQRAASAWLQQALGLLEAGRVVLVDYADTTPALARRPWTEWLRTYRHHRPGGPPLDAPGSQDITCMVATDQLAAVRPPASDRTQAAWLAANGIDELVAAARVVWRERASLGDLEAMKARSRVLEADALMEATGMGAFRVIEWVVQ